VREVPPDFLSTARSAPAFASVDVDLRFDKPELQVGINRNRAQSLGISVPDVTETLQSALGGQRFGYFVNQKMPHD
jgi:multidrug efflux pump subunit AcrB